MGVTSLGIVYADPTHNTRIWELDKEQADSLNALLVTHFGKPIVNTYTVSGVWNKPAGTQKVRVRSQAPGGAGGGAQLTAGGTHSKGAGGGGGQYAERWYDASELAGSITVTMGAPGTGVVGAAGNAGGNNSFVHTTPLVTVGGSGGGTANAAATAFGISGGPGGTGGSGATYSVSGGAGGNGWGEAALAVSGQGGDSHLGGGGAPRSNASQPANLSGAAGSVYGGGGGGALNAGAVPAVAGGAGAVGIQIIESYK